MNSLDRKEVIKEIQSNLRTLYKGGIIDISIVPTGVYDERTAAAIKELQRSAGLPETGITDRATWAVLTDAANRLKNAEKSSEPIYPFEQMTDGGCVRPGECSDLVYIIQVMLACLAGYDFEDVSICGDFDSATEDAVREFQRINGLEESGEVDKSTWNALAGAYNRSIKQVH